MVDIVEIKSLIKSGHIQVNIVNGNILIGYPSSGEWVKIGELNTPKFGDQVPEDTFVYGDICHYISPVKSGLRTKCIFIRDEWPKAVVMFENAEFAAKVLYRDLEKICVTSLN